MFHPKDKNITSVNPYFSRVTETKMSSHRSETKQQILQKPPDEIILMEDPTGKFDDTLAISINDYPPQDNLPIFNAYLTSFLAFR